MTLRPAPFAAAGVLLLAGCQAAVTPTTGYAPRPAGGTPAAGLASAGAAPSPTPSGAVVPAPDTASAARAASVAPPAPPTPPSVVLAAPAHDVAIVPAAAASAADPRSTGFNLYGQFEGVQPEPSRDGSADAGLSRITSTTEGDDFDVAPAPDGETLYFASTRHRPTADLYRQAIGGTSVTQLTDDPANDVMPAVSPDGRRIAFASDRSGTWDLYLMDAGGGRAVKLTDDDGHNVHPSFSPDGQRLVYSSFSPHAGGWELVVIDVDRPTKKRIIGRGLFPVWSPADDTIAFQRARERGSRWFSVWTVQLEDGEAVRPTEVAVSSNAAVITPRWSPDGESLVFCTVLDPAGEDPTQPTRADVWTIRRDGSGRSKLTTGDAANLQPSWGPDGRVYFISDRGSAPAGPGRDGGVENIWSVRPRGVAAAGGPGAGAVGLPVAPADADAEADARPGGGTAGPGDMQAGVPTGP
ncbi:TolB family protein [Phycisphaera mikurensis]|uniref:TolB family protein n=1 Tax=Phycisphaera mikurensis TaxID=547188 RepID=UPI00059B6C81|nr:DPP IV N-terminal domain-containing protein [Phycisphaera mikurensis]MBB6442455.1 TolB protein [Phycisphaera mikurensis]